ncbi:hypothetical protein WBG06_03520 [Nocardioides sp. CCNWLW239]|uniref:hypothetical protein n=1 Tax=Nocardioides sp. CCNWLW239 TaxID=3128902 RepID=UPI003019F299
MTLILEADMDWHDALERAIPQAPPTHHNPAALVADGKKLVRRRRVAAVAGTALAVGAVLGIGSIVVPSGADRATPPVATQSAESDEPPAPDPSPPTEDAPVTYDHRTDEVGLYPGWKVVDRIGPNGVADSVAVEATDGAKTLYVHFMNPTEISYVDASRTSATSLEAWLDDVKSHDLAINWRPRGELRARGGWKIVREIPNPLGVAAPWDSMAAVVEREGLERWVLYNGDRSDSGRESTGRDGTYAIPGQTIDEWLAGRSKEFRKEFEGKGVGDFGVGMGTTRVVTFGSGSEIVPAKDGVEVVEQRTEPDVDGFSAGASRSAAAKITVDGAERFVLVREVDGDTQAYSYEVGQSPWAEDRVPISIDEYLDIIDSVPSDGMWQ